MGVEVIRAKYETKTENNYRQKRLQRLRTNLTGFAGKGICSVEKKSQNVSFTICGRMFRTWFITFIRFEDDGSREMGSGSIK